MSQYGNVIASQNSNHKLNERPNLVNVIDGKKRYYSALDAEIFFGDIFVDDITDIGWGTQQQTLPIFGYNSYTFDGMAVGSRMVQGQFSTNFHQRSYLQNLQNDPSFVSIARMLYGEEDKNKTSAFTSTYRKRLNLPVWDKGFDIVIAYGTHGESAKGLKESTIATYVVIECCQITGSQTMLTSDGMPVTETYTFTARDVRYVHDEDRTEVDVDTGESATTDDTINAFLEVYSNDAVGICASIESQIDISKNNTFSIKTDFGNKALNAEFKFEAFDEDSNKYIGVLNQDLSKALLAGIKKLKLDEIEVTLTLHYTVNDTSKVFSDIDVIIDVE